MTTPYQGTRVCIDCGLRVVALSTCTTTGDVHGPSRSMPNRWVVGRPVPAVPPKREP